MIPGVKHISEIRAKTLNIIKDRRAGKIKSFRSPWKKLNKQLLDGFDWGSIVVIAGPSGSGKTAVADQIVHEAQKHNPEFDGYVLKFQMEMTDEQTGVRELTSNVGFSMQQLYSADEGYRLTDKDIEMIERFYQSKKTDNIFQCSDPKTVNQAKAIITSFYEDAQKPMIVYFDHSILTKKSADENSQLETLQNLTNACVELKKKIPNSIYIILTQTNRSLDDQTRKVNGSIVNYPIKGDIYGGDALYQGADTVLVIMRPKMQGINIYGPHKFLVQDKHVVMHIIKNRYNNLTALFFEEDLKHFRILECDPPEQQK